MAIRISLGQFKGSSGEVMAWLWVDVDWTYILVPQRHCPLNIHQPHWGDWQPCFGQATP